MMSIRNSASDFQSCRAASALPSTGSFGRWVSVPPKIWSSWMKKGMFWMVSATAGVPP
jgi:hypothetical protein